jgi:hypothetical protein
MMIHKEFTGMCWTALLLFHCHVALVPCCCNSGVWIVTIKAAALEICEFYVFWSCALHQTLMTGLFTNRQQLCVLLISLLLIARLSPCNFHTSVGGFERCFQKHECLLTLAKF